MLRLCDQPTQVLPAGLIRDQQGQRQVMLKGQLGAKYRLDAQSLSRFLKLDCAINIVVVGQRQPFHAQTTSLREQGAGCCCAAQEAIRGMRAELDISAVSHKYVGSPIDQSSGHGK